MAKLTKDLVVRLDDVVYENMQQAEDQFEIKGISHIGCDSGYSLIEYSSQAVDVLVDTNSITRNQGLEIKRLNPDKILVVIKWGLNVYYNSKRTSIEVGS